MPVHVLKPMRDEHVNVTPLIDVVMCLIIFFLLVGQMAKEEINQSIVLPAIVTPGKNPDDENRLILNVVAQTDPHNPTMKLGTLSPRIYLGQIEIPSANLFNTLFAAKARNHDLRIALRADSAVDYQFIAPILTTCANANIRTINFAARLRQEKPSSASP